MQYLLEQINLTNSYDKFNVTLRHNIQILLAASKGFLHASHFCYLMSQTSFGSYNKKSSKIVLIGSSHGLPLEYFANNEAVQCTEIYEYALALGNTMINLVNFQVRLLGIRLSMLAYYLNFLSDLRKQQELLMYLPTVKNTY